MQGHEPVDELERPRAVALLLEPAPHGPIRLRELRGTRADRSEPHHEVSRRR